MLFIHTGLQNITNIMFRIWQVYFTRIDARKKKPHKQEFSPFELSEI